MGDHEALAGAGRRVVIVEDNERNLRLIRHVLERAGFSVAGVSTGEEVLAAVRAERPDLLLVDIQLRGSALDGEDVLQAVRADPAIADLVVVALTAFAVRGDEERLLAAGFDGYVAKPIDVRAIVGQLLSYLQTVA
ncbi:MAG TPA: response regulator [Acidimicrobiales bacterium]|nr:response regulator [Acidimicrobiales bacterium]